MEIKDVIHLYLGCDVLVDGETTGTLVGISHTYDIELYVNNQWLHHRFCKLILRPLSSMTEEEMNECWFNMEGAVEIRCEYKDGGVKKFDATPAQVVYLLSKGFDLFGLIDAGLAIDRVTTLR